jgi:two-component system, sensor histidine kinase and response regulator
VHNGLQAVERLAAAGPDVFDVVLMDLQMPVLDGLQATMRLRAQKRFDHLPIVAFTAHALAEENARARAAGMQGYLTKPLNVKELVNVLQPYLGRTAQLATAPSPAGLDAGHDASIAAPTAASSPPHSVAGLPQISGLDMQRALSHFDDSHALLLRTLGGFARAYSHNQGAGIAHWHDWVKANHWGELHRAAHTLQGLAGTIGAGRLRELALNVEQLSKAQDASATPAALMELQEALRDMVNALEEGLSPRNTDFTHTVTGELGLPPAQALAVLRELLEHSDSEAVDWWQTHRVALQQVLPPPLRRSMGLAIARYDFDHALAALAASTRRQDALSDIDNPTRPAPAETST